MRRAAKVDGNHVEIVSALRKAGAKVQSLASIGKGVPDLLVGFRFNFFVIEIKDGDLSPSRRKLTEDQIAWHREWAGFPVATVHNAEEALKAIRAIQ